jgi:D-glycerate 3-kinase
MKSAQGEGSSMVRRLRLATLTLSTLTTPARGAAFGGRPASYHARSLSMRAPSSEAIEYARIGPLHQTLEIALQDRLPKAEEWTERGNMLAAQLCEQGQGLGPSELQRAMAVRIYHLYLPIYFFLRDCVREQRSTSPVAIGLSAPQGCGKTTLVELLVDLFAADGLGCTAVSIDDFYLAGEEQDAVATANPENPLLQVRGNAGTHDLGLGTKTLRSLKAGEHGVPIPLYDKAARGGRGDRAPPSAWPVAPHTDVVLLEGWMAGFEATTLDEELLSTHKGLSEINARLEAYEAWHSLMDAWVVLAVDNPRCVYDWRLQAEHAMAAAGRPGMSDAQVADFVSRYMPAYHAYLPGLYRAAERDGVGGKPTMLVHVDRDRSPVASGS